MVRQCFKCKKLDFLNPYLSYYKFPKESKKRNLWINILGLKTKVIPKICYLCSDHFDKIDISYSLRGSCTLQDNVLPKFENVVLLAQDRRLCPVQPDVRIKVESDESNEEQGGGYVLNNYTIKTEEIFLKDEHPHRGNSNSSCLDDREKGNGINSESQCVVRLFKDNRCEIFKCSFCDYETPLHSHLKRHLTGHVGMHKCDKCNYETSDETYFIKHARRHLLPGNVYLLCNECTFETRWKHCLIKHFRRLHQNKFEQFEPLTLYKCNKCSFRTVLKAVVRRHIRERICLT